MTCGHRGIPDESMIVTFYGPRGGAEERAIVVRRCRSCRELLKIAAATTPLHAESRAAALIQAIEYAVATGANVRDAARNAMTFGEAFGWAAAPPFFGTDPWDAGWLAAAYFDHDPHRDGAT